MSENARYRNSTALFQRAQQVIPGGIHLSGRPLTAPGRSPMYFQRGQGCRVVDVDHHVYIDFIMGFGPFLLGYANEQVDEAARTQLEKGPLLSMNHPLHVHFAETLIARFAPAEMAMFFKTGTEATTAALRVARRATGRRRVVRSGYHGWNDWCLPLEDFVPAGLDQQVLEFNPREPSTLEALFARFPGEIAAVILAPEMIYPPEAGLFERIASATRKAGAVFVLDEVKTCLRTPPGSMQRRLGLTPDLTTVSKALGNGWPVAAVVGRRDVMECAAGMHVSATYHGDTAAMAASLRTMELVDELGVAEEIWGLGQRLIDGLNNAAAQADLPAIAYAEPIPSMPFLRFTHPDPAVCGKQRDTFYEALFERGVLLHPRHMNFVSHAHAAQDIEIAIAAAEESMKVAAALCD